MHNMTVIGNLGDPMGLQGDPPLRPWSDTSFTWLRVYAMEEFKCIKYRYCCPISISHMVKYCRDS